MIRAIDGDLQKQLGALGVKRFAEIADWKPQDVARVAATLKVPGRIEQENWIEQAQILAKGGETYYSRRKARARRPRRRRHGRRRTLAAACPRDVAASRAGPGCENQPSS